MALRLSPSLIPFPATFYPPPHAFSSLPFPLSHSSLSNPLAFSPHLRFALLIVFRHGHGLDISEHEIKLSISATLSSEKCCLLCKK